MTPTSEHNIRYIGTQRSLAAARSSFVVSCHAQQCLQGVTAGPFVQVPDNSTDRGKSNFKPQYCGLGGGEDVGGMRPL
jgi:hypothetical protein